MSAQEEARWLVRQRLENGRKFPHFGDDSAGQEWHVWWSDVAAEFERQTGEAFEAYSERMIGQLDLHCWGEQ